MTVSERLNALRERMQEQGIAALVVPTADPHGSEYLSEHDQIRRYLSGFTGSAGTLVVHHKGAALFTDGRYFIQAQRQLAGSGIELMRMRCEGVPTLTEYLCTMPGSVGVDFELISEAERRMFEDALSGAGLKLCDAGALAASVWQDRPGLPDGKAFALPERIAGRSRKEKLADIRAWMHRAGAKGHLVCVLDEIAWLLNIRGADIKNTPVVRSYLLVRDRDALWFVDPEKVPSAVQAELKEDQVELVPYEACRDTLEKASGPILAAPAKTNAALWQALPSVAEGENPAFLLKCIKNETEIAHLRDCHERDGAALTRLMYWLKTSEEPMTECSVQEKLLALRAEQKDFLGPSFDTICAYGENGAMMHYKATEESDARIERKGFLLIDSGGQYLDGTTDVTRTFAMGPLTQEEKKHFTAVLQAVINLASAKFLSGMAGKGLDILARGPIWRLGLDYRCGTGHGVGFLLCVHEGPNSFRWHESAARGEETVLVPGMVTTDEPGIYLEGRYGIRTENELVCIPLEKNEYGQFLGFETITYAPVDLDAVLAEELTTAQREWLNAYHETVRARLMPYMQGEKEQAWLVQATRAL